MRDPLIGAVAMAAAFHSGQTDKTGQPYMLHLLRVLDTIRTAHPDNLVIQMAAVLHDILEDTEADADWLVAQNILPGVVHLVQTLTKPKGIAYEAWIRWITTQGWQAVAIKRADVADNLSRNFLIEDPAERERLRMKYLGAQAILLGRSAPSPEDIAAAGVMMMGRREQ